jgi:hypothetical protein
MTLSDAFETFLQNIRASNHIEFTVTCNASNNPHESIALGYIICDIIGTPNQKL